MTESFDPSLDLYVKAALGRKASGLVVLDNKGIVVSFNRAAEDITGYQRDSVQGLRLIEVLERSHEEIPLAAEGLVEAALADPHGLEQIVEGCSLVALRPEQAHGLIQRSLLIEFPRPGHLVSFDRQYRYLGPICPELYVRSVESVSR